MKNIDGEINNFIIVWTTVAATLCYCHTIGKLISQGISRLIAIFPAIVLLLLLPLRLTSAHLGAPSSFFIGWLSTFKLLLFSFDKGPLSSNPPLPLLHFIPLASLPIKFQHQPLKSQNENHKSHSPLRYPVVTIVIILAYLIPLHGKKEFFHPKFTLFLYSIHMYIGLEFFFVLASTFARKLLNVELEPQFYKPYLCTSLQDFWGKRWNISVNRLLHPTVYEPVVIISSHLIERKWAPLPGILATFIVSAMMHELMFYYNKKEERTWEGWEPSWDSTCFLVIHGLCLAIEVGLKKVFRGKWRLSRIVSWPLTMVFTLYTVLWLFVPALVRCHIYEKLTAKMSALTQIVEDVYHVGRLAFLHVKIG